MRWLLVSLAFAGCVTQPTAEDWLKGCLTSGKDKGFCLGVYNQEIKERTDEMSMIVQVDHSGASPEEWLQSCLDAQNDRDYCFAVYNGQIKQRAAAGRGVQEKFRSFSVPQACYSELRGSHCDY